MKNYADLYNSENDSIALEQRWYVKEEVTRGTLIGPTDADFVFMLTGGSIDYTQPFESSPHRSGRHHTNIIKSKKECAFSFPSFFNIDETLGAASTAEIDPAMRVLFKSLFGKEVTAPNLKYTSGTEPDVTFSLFNVGDKWAFQSRGGFVQGGGFKFPGDGNATVDWSGNAVEAKMVGIGKSTENNTGGNTVTLDVPDEAWRFPVGAMVMLVEANGTTRSTDTPNGVYRTVVTSDPTTGVVLVSGATLTDADGSVTPVYLVYAEPTTPTAINNPVTGLVGSASFAGLDIDCFRNIELNIQNGHELVNYCYGQNALHGRIFVPGSRFTAELTAELNQNELVVEFYNKLQAFQAQVFALTLGSPTGRRLELALPKVFMQPPSFSVPDTGSVPISFKGNAYQSAFDAADEVTLEFK